MPATASTARRPLHSALYEGSVRHRRFAPFAHAFRYRLFMMYLDLAELPEVFRGRWLWSVRRPALVRFRREDYLGDPAVPLDEAVRALVADRTGARPTGPVRLLTHLRTLGHVFNPLSVYYVFAPDGVTLETLVLEVSNTPWGERHCYVLPVDAPREDAAGGQPGRGLLRFSFGKTFHVSPFLGMDMAYRLLARPPGAHLSLQLENVRDGERLFDATLQLRRRELTGFNMAAVLLRHPAMPLRGVAAIYWQALRLWRKGAVYHPHPVNA